MGRKTKAVNWDKATLTRADNFLKNHKLEFRSFSHLSEVALNQYLDKREEDEKKKK